MLINYFLIYESEPLMKDPLALLRIFVVVVVVVVVVVGFFFEILLSGIAC